MAVPASPTPAVAGTRQHGEKQEKKEKLQETWIFLCFDRLPFGSASSTYVVP